MHILELKVPPLALVLFVSALMWLVTWATPNLQFTIPARYLLSIGFACTGIIIIAVGLASFRQAGEPNEARLIVGFGGVWNLWPHPQPDVSRIPSPLDWVGDFLDAPVGLPACSCFFLLHKSFPNRT